MKLYVVLVYQGEYHVMTMLVYASDQDEAKKQAERKLLSKPNSESSYTFEVK